MISLKKMIVNTDSSAYCFASYKNDTHLLGGGKMIRKQK